MEIKLKAEVINQKWEHGKGWVEPQEDYSIDFTAYCDDKEVSSLKIPIEKDKKIFQEDLNLAFHRILEVVNRYL